MKAAFRQLKEHYIRFVEKQGFPVLVTLCVAVITATAVWTTQKEAPYVSPTPPVVEDISAAQLMQQSLRSAYTSTPAPTETPCNWVRPLDEISVIQPFSSEKMVYSSVTGIWAVHTAVDLACQSGDKVYAISDGEVISAGIDKLKGAWLEIDHDNGITALYAGMMLTADYIAGDTVRSGAVIGYAGNKLLSETSLGPHLHLEVKKDNVPIDPQALWESSP